MYILKPGHEKEWAVQFFKSFSVDSMQRGKQILFNISNGQPYTSLNAFLLDAGKELVGGGGYWGWKNLSWELLSNKYGVAAVYDRKTKKTKFVFRLPPIEDIREEINNEVERLKKEAERIDNEQRQQEEFTRMMLDIAHTLPRPYCFQPAYPCPHCTVYGTAGQS